MSSTAGPPDDRNELRQRIQRMALDLSRTRHELESMLVEFEFCNLTFNRDLYPNRGSNVQWVMGAMNRSQFLPDLFAPESRGYFSRLWEIRDLLEQAPERNGDRGWQVRSATDDSRLDFTRWLTPRRDDWQIAPTAAVTRPDDPDAHEFFLCSPECLVPEQFDCRIEYTAWADQDPCELSAILGPRLEWDPTSGRLLIDPARYGYCFAFGAYGNALSTLQRALRSQGYTDRFKIVPGRRHHYIAERAGGRLRLTVDGAVVFTVIDPSPLVTTGGDYITLYSSNRLHHFADFKLHLRPSCLTPAEWDLVASCRRQTLQLLRPEGPLYLDTRVVEFDPRPESPEIRVQFKNVTKTVTEHLTAEKHKKAEEALREANLVLEEKIAERTAELHEALNRLRASEQRYALAALGANDGLWDWNFEDNTVYFSPRFKEMLGYSDREIENSLAAWDALVEPEDLEGLKQALQQHLNRHTDQFTHEYRMRHKNGQVRWVQTRGAAIRGPDGSPLRLAGSQTDITARKAAELELRHDAMHDALTGLPNRALFRLKVSEALHRRDTTGEAFAILFIDLDGFKGINDTRGHLVGDQILEHVARRLERAVRPGDVVARMGGDEFTVLLANTGNREQIDRVAERILGMFGEDTLIQGEPTPIGASVGIAVGRSDLTTADEIIRKADSAMYHIKLAKRK